MPHLVTITKVNISQLDVFKALADLILEVSDINLRVKLGFLGETQISSDLFKQQEKQVQPKEVTPTRCCRCRGSVLGYPQWGVTEVPTGRTDGEVACDRAESGLDLLTSRDHLHSHTDLAFPEPFKDLRKVARSQLLTECELFPRPLPVIPVGQGLSFVLERQKGE